MNPEKERRAIDLLGRLVELDAFRGDPRYGLAVAVLTSDAREFFKDFTPPAEGRQP